MSHIFFHNLRTGSEQRNQFIQGSWNIFLHLSLVPKADSKILLFNLICWELLLSSFPLSSNLSLSLHFHWPLGQHAYIVFFSMFQLLFESGPIRTQACPRMKLPDKRTNKQMVCLHSWFGNSLFVGDFDIKKKVDIGRWYDGFLLLFLTNGPLLTYLSRDQIVSVAQPIH